MTTRETRSARLILNTIKFYPQNLNSISAPGTADTSFGYADALRANCTYTNLDWQEILGDLYDKYETFAFDIESIFYVGSGGTTFSAVNPTGVIQITATGLEWLNQTYNVVTKTKNENGPAVIYTGSLAGGFIDNTQQYGTLYFKKPTTRYKDFTLTIKNMPAENQVTGADRPAALIYTINIFGVDENDQYIKTQKRAERQLTQQL